MQHRVNMTTYMPAVLYVISLLHVNFTYLHVVVIKLFTSDDLSLNVLYYAPPLLCTCTCGTTCMVITHLS